MTITDMLNWCREGKVETDHDDENALTTDDMVRFACEAIREQVTHMIRSGVTPDTVSVAQTTVNDLVSNQTFAPCDTRRIGKVILLVTGQ